MSRITENIGTPPPSVPPSTAVRSRDPRVPILVVALVLTILLGAGVSTFFALRARRNADMADSNAELAGHYAGEAQGYREVSERLALAEATARTEAEKQRQRAEFEARQAAQLTAEAEQQRHLAEQRLRESERALEELRRRNEAGHPWWRPPSKPENQQAR